MVSSSMNLSKLVKWSIPAGTYSDKHDPPWMKYSGPGEKVSWAIVGRQSYLVGSSPQWGAVLEFSGEIIYTYPYMLPRLCCIRSPADTPTRTRSFPGCSGSEFHLRIGRCLPRIHPHLAFGIGIGIGIRTDI